MVNRLTKIFKENGELYFDTSYLPKQLPHREEQLETLIGLLKDGIEKGVYRIPIIYGITGTGKTTTVRYVLKILNEKYRGRIETCMINATSNSRTYLAVHAIASELIPLPRRGLSVDEIIAQLYDRLYLEDLIYVTAIDDSDELIRRDRGKILELLSRIEENYDKRLLLPIIVVRNVDIVRALPSHITSKIGSLYIEFPPYRKHELRDILDERIKLGLRDNTITENAIECATWATENLFGGNARELLNITSKAIKYAEKLDSEKVLVEHIRVAIYDSYTKTIPYTKRLLTINREAPRILWSLLKSIRDLDDTYYINEEFIREGYKIYVNTFNIKMDWDKYRDVIHRLAEDHYGILSSDNNKIIAANYPLKHLYNLLTQQIFFP